MNGSRAVVLLAGGGLSYAFVGDSDAAGSTARTVAVARSSVERMVPASDR